jgi:hypothetical protein
MRRVCRGRVDVRVRRITELPRASRGQVAFAVGVSARFRVESARFRADALIMAAAEVLGVNS